MRRSFRPFPSRVFHPLSAAFLLATAACSYTLIEKPGANELADGLNLEQQGKTRQAAEKFLAASKHSQDKDLRARALFELSQLTMRGDGVQRDVPRGFELLSQASALEDDRATFQLAESYRTGNRVPPNAQKAAELYRKIAPHYPAAGLALAELEANDHVKPQGASARSLIDTSLPNLEWQAAKGNAGAMVLLAHDYRDGVGVAQDAGKAEEWYRAAIALGNDTAAVELADLWLATGKRTHFAPDAAKLLRQAAKAGNVSAMIDLAHLEEDGIDGPPDFAAARDWYEKAAGHGNPNAMAALGRIYLTGNAGVKADPAKGIDWLNKAVAAGAAGAYTDLANAYMNGVGVTQDQPRAVAYLKKAVASGSFGALIDLGNAYRDGTGVTVDYRTAMGCYQKALKNGIPAANVEIGRLYLSGYGVPQNAAMAAQYFAAAAKADVIGAARGLGDLYAAGNGVAKDPAQAAHWYEIAARQGDRFAMVALGDAYTTGTGVPKDDAKAAALYKDAADLGSVQGLLNLAHAYHTGAGVDKDEAKARATVDRILTIDNAKFYSVGNAYAKDEVVAADPSKAFSLYQKALAAEPANVDYVRKVAECYERGFGTPIDYTKAFQGFTNAAAKGDTLSMAKVAKAYETGLGVTPDTAQAVAWRRKAAEAGEPESMVKLAQLYAFGSGVSADMKQSIAWYEKAAAAGNAEAQYQLGVSYARGVGMARDVPKARMWLNKAKANGYPIAGQVLETLLKSQNSPTTPEGSDPSSVPAAPAKGKDGGD